MISSIYNNLLPVLQQAPSTYDHSAWNPGVYLADNTVVLLEHLNQGTQNITRTELEQNNTRSGQEQLAQESVVEEVDNISNHYYPYY